MANISFGERIRRARIRNAMSQSDLAEKLDVTQATISNWETGRSRPRAEQKTEIKRVLGDVAQERVQANDDTSAEPGPSAFGAWLNRTRNERQMSVAELAEKSGLSAPAIYNIESGRIANPRAGTVHRLEDALGQELPAEAKREIREEATIKGVGELIDFDPHSDDDLPSVAGIYVFYDISERPIYVGQSGDIRARVIRDHREKFWFRPPITKTGAYVEIDDKALREKVETLLIRFLKSNAVINKQNVDR
jgi:transcriptional regulator with XRE-family HTH domain